MSLIYGAVVITRRWLYQNRVLKRYRPRAHVISIGNITAGGTGKTPCTILLAELLSKKRVAILLRGYHSQSESEGAVRVTAQQSFHTVGDEAALLYKRIPNAAIYVGKKRTRSAEQAVKEGAEVLIMDDGFQHLAIERDIDICLVDATNPFGHGFLLPRGLLREPLSALRYADIVCITRAEQDTTLLQQKIKTITQSPIIVTRMKVEGLFDQDDHPVACAPAAPVALFSGIGNPKSFYESASSLGLHIVLRYELADHEAIEEALLQELAEKACSVGAQFLVCTEKDRVKLEKIALPLPVVTLRIAMEVIEGQEVLQRITALPG